MEVYEMSRNKIKKFLSSPEWEVIATLIIGTAIMLGGIGIVKANDHPSDFSYEIKEVELSDGSYVNCLVTKDGNDHTMQCDWQHRTIKGHSYE